MCGTCSGFYMSAQPSVLGNPTWRIQDGRHLKTITSYDAITSCCGPQRKFLCTNYLSSKCHCHSFYTIEVMERGDVVGGRNYLFAVTERMRKVQKDWVILFLSAVAAAKRARDMLDRGQTAQQ